LEDEDIEDEDVEDEDTEDEIMEDAGEDATFVGPPYTTESEQGEDAPVEVSDDELV
jgi:hypothetical protein